MDQTFRTIASAITVGLFVAGAPRLGATQEKTGSEHASGSAHAGHSGHPVRPTAEEAYLPSRLSEGGTFRVSYRSDPAILPLNALHTWKLTVATAGGEPVKDADVAVTATMPEHGHGMPTKPAVTKNLGDGTYLVEGLKFSMPGWWVLTFRIRAGAASDVVSFNVRLD